MSNKISYYINTNQDVARATYFFIFGFFLLVLGGLCNGTAIYSNGNRMPVYTSEFEKDNATHFTFTDKNAVNNFIFTDIFPIYFSDYILLYSIGDIFLISAIIFCLVSDIFLIIALISLKN